MKLALAAVRTGEEDEDEPAPGPTKGIRVERDDRPW
jgi:hypothetical protein